MRIFIAVVAIALLAGTALLYRSNDKASVEAPVVGAASRNVLDKLQPETAAVIAPELGVRQDSPGTRLAASERSTHARNCAFAFRSKASIDAQLKVCEAHDELRSHPEHADFFASCDTRTKKFEEQLAPLSATLRMCTQKTQLEAEAEFYEATKRAALLGDVDAQLCYTQATFFTSQDWTDAEKALYKKNATSFIEAALERGDWRFIEVLRLATSKVIAQSGLLGQVATADRGDIYRYNRLLRLGAATKEYQGFLDAMSDDPGAPLPLDVKRRGDEWAEKMYNANFRTSPRLAASPATCSEVESI